MRNTRCAGGIVLGDHGTIALVRRDQGRGWTFPKGHIDEGETDEEAALREISEETGLANLEYIDDLGSYERYRISADGISDDKSELKEIHLYLYAAQPHTALSADNEIGAAEWVPLPKVIDTLTHPKDRAWFTTVFERVRQAVQRD
ncbi:MAG TPA: NUDIX domain-containing protein [Candidatus Paceibacterota bacterium]|nr:NUDIX domain-containing protein [Candidatus Paceibacterota bacterium]